MVTGKQDATALARRQGVLWQSIDINIAINLIFPLDLEVIAKFFSMLICQYSKRCLRFS
jgi:hypothetical protein